jgi:membrane-bound lytic murein transglycosylase D
MDPEKSTAAAIAYLTELHKIFGDWMTVLAAYNCGEGRVLRVIRNQNIKYLDNFWDLYQRLPLETARFVPRFLATLHILKDPAKYGFELPEPDAPLSFEKVTVNRQVGLEGISKELNIPLPELKELNPELRYGVLPADSYTLRIPPGHGEPLLNSIDRIAVTHPPRPVYTEHLVRRGETLSTLAERYRTTTRRIMEANNLRRSDYIIAGKTLKIPHRGAPSGAAASTANSAPPGIHVVRRGDSLWIIAKKYRTTVQKIQALNNLTTTTLSIGQQLRISGQSTAANNVAATGINPGNLRRYVVKTGDNPFTIAKRHDISVDRLLQLNQLSESSTIYPGQILVID